MSKVVNVKQNTPEWLVWRERGLGASDAPVIMGASPWTTPFKLWAYKTGLLKRPIPNSFQAAAMQRGHDLEPGARKRYEGVTGLRVPSTSFEHKEYPYLRASLDGFDPDTKKNVEIKCPGKADHALAMKGIVPAKYVPQVQMQMLVSGAKSTDYFSWDGKDSHALITVMPDVEYQKYLLDKLVAFWQCVLMNTPPECTPEELGEVLGVVEKDLNKLSTSFRVLSLSYKTVK